MIELSLNEVETLGAKAARAAGFAWGLADDVGRAARKLAQEGADWSGLLLALLADAPDFAGALCPVRTAAFLNDAQPEGEGPMGRVGRPIWLDALLGDFHVEGDLAAASAQVTLRRGRPPAPARARRAFVACERLDALNGYAARLYVPESESSRARGAGGGRVDDE